jgi:electron transport complex protein RnfG
MTKSYRLIFVLTATAILSGLLLSFLNIHTEPLIAAHQMTVLNNALSSVLPGCEKIEEKNIKDQQFYFGYDATDKVTGVAFLTEGNGFQSKLRILVGMNPQLNQITRISILEQKETPGLGTKIETDPSRKDNPQWFPNQFSDLNLSRKISLVKNQTADKTAGEIMAITGATISSKAVIDIINAAIARNRKILSENSALSIDDCPAITIAEDDSFDPDMIPEGAELCEIDGKTFCLHKDNNGNIERVTFLAKGAGFQGTIKILVSMEPDFSAIQNIQIIDHNETENWGTRIISDPENNTDPGWFLRQFQKLAVKQPIKIVPTKPDKAAGEVQTISGATISSEAVVQILNNAIREYGEIYQKHKAN